MHPCELGRARSREPVPAVRIEEVEPRRIHGQPEPFADARRAARIDPGREERLIAWQLSAI
jgi:hypothetical protein